MKNLTSDELLLNLQDRLGNVSLHETVCSENDRGDVVDFLVDHGADVDIVDYDGYSPRRWAEINGQITGRKCNLALYRAFRKEEKKVRAKAKCCAYCKKSGSKEHELLRCSRCHVVVYCDATCQRAHWKVHKQSCEQGIKLDRPKITDVSPGIPLNYGRPDHIAVNEKFWVKVQIATNETSTYNSPHMVYDESRKCQFYVSPDESGYGELKELVKAEKVTFGEKSYFLASFDDAGDCTIYPNSSALRNF
eukprot:CAMPEP_0116046492 /NCGR_PEP_ID=MMETSP0321-20121206/28306_1 /TAXON_ID=163516 /ORGANISM="Leptocylindrus danicus var. danicus, Strain B650" /LENGTH=248 /DNA_ID=CAMNT_0003528147 /DNA_START=150 /DNA_END=896 /DNA_ORIENTATION=-